MNNDNALAPNEHLCFLCADHTVSILHCPRDPALIRSDNTVRNEISTIGLQSLSSYSKGLLKHSAALSLSFSPSLLLFLLFSASRPPSACFSSNSFSLLCHLCPPCPVPYYSACSSFVQARPEHKCHTQSLSRLLYSNITATRFFSIWNESVFSPLCRQEAVVKWCSQRSAHFSALPSRQSFRYASWSFETFLAAVVTLAFCRQDLEVIPGRKKIAVNTFYQQGKKKFLHCQAQSNKC